MIAHLFIAWFTEYLKPTVLLLRKKDSFQNFTAHLNATGHPRAVIEMNDEINVVFMPANTISILQPMDQ